MTVLHLASPAEVRARVDAVHEDIRIPHPSAKFPRGEIVVPWKTITTVDRLALLGGFRISEIVTKFSGEKGNTSNTLSIDDNVIHRDTKQKVLLIRVNTLKKKAPVQREIGIPLSQEHEPWASMVAYQWRNAGGNPCNISRQVAWAANRIIFKGLGYKVRSWIRYKRNEKQRIQRDANGKKIIIEIIPEHIKQGSDHFLRHIRTTELRQMQFTPEERANFYKWSPITFGGNPLLETYDNIEWFEMFPKLLKERRI